MTPPQRRGSWPQDEAANGPRASRRRFPLACVSSRPRPTPSPAAAPRGGGASAAAGGRGGAVPWRRPGGGGRGRRVQVGSRESLAGRESGRRGDPAAPPLSSGACFLVTPRCGPSKGKGRTSCFWSQGSLPSSAHGLRNPWTRVHVRRESPFGRKLRRVQLHFICLSAFREILLWLPFFFFFFFFKRVPE